MGERGEQNVRHLSPEISSQGHEALGDPACTKIDKSQRARCRLQLLTGRVGGQEVDLKTRLRETNGKPSENLLGAATGKMRDEQTHPSGPSRSDGHVEAH
jgi:hypothetical protein